MNSQSARVIKMRWNNAGSQEKEKVLWGGPANKSYRDIFRVWIWPSSSWKPWGQNRIKRKKKKKKKRNKK